MMDSENVCIDNGWDGPKLGPSWGQFEANLRPSWGQVGPKLGQVGTKLRASSGQVGPSWANLGLTWAS
eukprot:6077155-Karenia_brevis.AAC.1